jgi:hypothetical protein
MVVDDFVDADQPGAAGGVDEDGGVGGDKNPGGSEDPPDTDRG